VALDWPTAVAEARIAQERLRDQVILEDRLGKPRLVAGVDVGFEDAGRITRAAVAVLTFPGLELHEHAVSRRETTFPYVPGYLSFREIPAVLDALEQLATVPDVVLCDGHGFAHPRRCGLASHLGILIDVPTVGVAKSRLVGFFEMPGERKGSWTPLMDDDEIIGAVLRTRTGVRPLFVSTGHRVSLETAVDLTLRCVTRFRLPETTRWAHRLASG
jgi:deoxyribonuclease V